MNEDTMLRFAQILILVLVGCIAGILLEHGCSSHTPNQTKVNISKDPIPDELTKPEASIPNPDELVVFEGLKRENDELRREAQQLRAEYLEALHDRAGRVDGQVDSVEQHPSLAQVCARAVETRSRAGLSPLFQANAGINVLLGVFAREQHLETGFAENRRFGLLPIDVATNNPVIEVSRSKTVLRWWDPMNAHWLQSTYRHRRVRRSILYAGAGALATREGIGYGVSASVDLHAGSRFRLAATGVLDALQPDNSAALATIQLGF